MAEVFNRAAALESLDGDLELLRELADVFLEEHTRWLDDIRSAINRKDSADIQRAAHTLKGAVASFSAEPSYEAAAALEEIGRTGSLQDAGSAYDRLVGALGALRPQLLDLVEEAS